MLSNSYDLTYLMENKEVIFNSDDIQNLIYTIRGLQVMLDSDLAELFKVETKYLNRAVKRNENRFPESFRFQLTLEEFDILKSQRSPSMNLRFQIDTSSSKHGGRRYQPFVFTEQGVAMLSGVLRSDTAIKVSIQIMDAFVNMRKFIATNAQIFQRLDNLERKQFDSDTKFEEIFNAIEENEITPKHGIFFEGQIFDAHTLVSDIVRSAKKSITIIDNYIDDTVLTLLTKRKKNVEVTICTKSISKRLSQDVLKFNAQYSPIQIKKLEKSHDRFIIIDENVVYHMGASLKDLGKKWFAFSKFDSEAFTLLEELNRDE